MYDINVMYHIYMYLHLFEGSVRDTVFLSFFIFDDEMMSFIIWRWPSKF